MGFLNQWIYGVAGPAGVFNDVTTGTNNANTGNGFTATKGKRCDINISLS